MTETSRKPTFGDLLRFYRGKTSTKYTGRPLSQEKFADELLKKVGVIINRNKVYGWEIGTSYIHQDDRKTLTAIVTIFFEFGSLNSLSEANHFLETGNYRHLDNQEIVQINPKWLVAGPTNPTEHGMLATISSYSKLPKEIIAANVDEVGKGQENVSLADTDSLEARQDFLSTWLGEKYYGEYVGHEEELAILAQRLSQRAGPVLLAVEAIGGMGKTAFCRELVERVYKQNLFLHIAWVQARLEQLGDHGEPARRRQFRLTFDHAMRDIAIELQIPHWPILEPPELKKRLKEFFGKEHCLVVIDGLEDAESPQTLAEELRNILGSSCAILSSRHHVGIAATELKLRKLTYDESFQFIRQVSKERYVTSDQNPLVQATQLQIGQIIDATDGMPLALKLVISQARFLDLDRIIERLSDTSKENQLYRYIFEDSWNAMDGMESAQRLLVLLAARNRPVPVTLMYGLQGSSQAEVDTSLRVLRDLSLVEYSHNAGHVQIGLHSLTRQFVNETLREKYL